MGKRLGIRVETTVPTLGTFSIYYYSSTICYNSEAPYYVISGSENRTKVLKSSTGGQLSEIYSENFEAVR